MTTEQRDSSLGAILAPYARRTEEDLQRWLTEPATPPELAEAMRYCVLGGGKRLRPSLTLMAAEAVAGEGVSELARRAAAAVEMIQCYSLVHDDLPGMDNDMLRRGRATVHVRFGEAMAILAGDALLTRAFGVLAEAGHLLSSRLAAELASAAGQSGMIAGQVADMDLCALPGGVEGLRYIHLRKTASLLRAAVRMGGLCGGADEPQMDALGRYGEALGLAFQVFDDILDVTGQAHHLGKTPGKDAQAGKKTCVAEHGLEGAQALGRQLTGQAVAALAPLGPAGEKLRMLAESLAERTR